MGIYSEYEDCGISVYDDYVDKQLEEMEYIESSKEEK